MLSFLLSNKYLAIAKWIGIAIAVWYIFHTWDKAQNYDSVKTQLEAETNCQKPSQCATRLLESAQHAAQVVSEKQAEVNAANAKAEQNAKKAAQAEADKNSAQVEANKAKAAAILAKHTKSCDEWEKQINPCGMQ